MAAAAHDALMDAGGAAGRSSPSAGAGAGGGRKRAAAHGFALNDAGYAVDASGEPLRMQPAEVLQDFL